jgi:gas vesicle protein
MANFAASRQAHFSAEIAKEIAQDRDAVREIEEAVLRRDALEALEVASTRRQLAADRRRRFLDNVRSTRSLAPEGRDRASQSVLRRGRSVLRSHFRGVSGTLLTGAAQLALPTEDEGAAGVLGRVGASALTGAQFGSFIGGVGAGAGAAVGFIYQSFIELKNQISNNRAEVKETREKLAEAIAETKRIEKELGRTLKDAMTDLEDKIKEQTEELAIELVHDRYRESRSVHLNLSGR